VSIAFNAAGASAANASIGIALHAGLPPRGHLSRGVRLVRVPAVADNACSAGRGISQADFDRVAFHLAAALAAAGVPAETIGAIASAIVPLADDIVSRGLS
jgi:hypothetical protein